MRRRHVLFAVHVPSAVPLHPSKQVGVCRQPKPKPKEFTSPFSPRRLGVVRRLDASASLRVAWLWVKTNGTMLG